MELTNTGLRGVFDEAVEIVDPAARSAFLDDACGGDAALRARVERLLVADSHAGEFLRERGDTTTANSISEKPGDRIGRYRLIERIGRGGGGVVYLADQEEPLRRRVALKILKLGMDTQSVVARFEAERQALAMMDHPNIARVLDAGATETGRPFFVMELVSGQKLSDYCEGRGLSMRQRLELFIPVCHAVQHAHQKGIVHRDLKPSNILVTEHEGAAVPKVIDFGIAKATERGLREHAGLTSVNQFLGTPAYMSPEQVECGGRDIDTRSDIYSLGVILYELLAGQLPFDPKELARAGLDEMRRIIREVDPPKPSTTITRNLNPARLPSSSRPSRERLAAVRGDLDWIVMKCLEKNRARRYETANGLAMDIRRHLENEPVVARPPTQIYRLRKIVRRHRLGFAATGIISLVLVAAVIVSGQLALRATRAEREQSRLRGVAETKAEESQDRLVRMTVADGNRLAEEGHPLSALPWFVEALQLDLGDPARADDARLRISSALHQSPRLAHILFHGKWINCIAFSPDGTRILTGASDSAGRIWDANTGELVLQLARQREQINSAQFSSDGKLIVTMDHTGTACLWDAVTGERVGPYLRAPDYNARWIPGRDFKLTPTACFSPDGKLLATAWGSKSAVIWDSGTGRLLRALPHDQGVLHAAFSRDGRYLVTCGLDRRAKTWDTQTGEPVGPPLEHAAHVDWSEFSPDGQSLMTVSQRRRVQVWDWRKGQPAGPAIKHDVVIFHASFSPDGRRILTASWDMLARIWDVATSQLIGQFEHPSGLAGAAFAPDGERFATACHDGTARVWQIGGRQTSISLPHGNEVDVVAFSPDGRRLAAGGKDGVVRLWDLAPDDTTTRTFPGRDLVWAEFSKDGGKLLTAGGTTGGVRLWDSNTGKELGPGLNHSDAVRKAIFSANGSRIATICEGTNAHLWDAASGRELVPPLQHSGRINDVAISPNQKHIATVGSDNTGRLWNAATGERTATLRHSNGVTAVAFSPDGRFVATGARDRSARIWNVDSGQPASPPLRQPSTVRQLRFSPDGQRLVTACYLQGATHGIAQLWDVASGQRLGVPMLHRDDIRTIEFSNDGRRIATASSDQTARVWDARTGEPISPPLSHRDSVVHAIFSPDGRRLATLASSGEMRIWNAATGEPITMPIPHAHRHDLGRLSFSPDGKRLLVATGAHEARLYDLTPEGGSVTELRLRAQLLSGKRFDSAGSITPLDSASLSNAWQQLRALRARN